jgi:hypothetical protein
MLHKVSFMVAQIEDIPPAAEKEDIPSHLDWIND